MKANSIGFLLGLSTSLLLTSFSVIQEPDGKQDKQDKKHIKVVCHEDGKKSVLDTFIVKDDILIWHGDTINPDELVERLPELENLEFFD